MLETPVEVLVRPAVRPADHVQRGGAGIESVLLGVEPDNIESRDLVQLPQVHEERVLDDVGGDVALQQRALELVEQV